jgi:predicted dehydrogenase
MTKSTIDVGVVGVGSMGQHHARVYNQLSGANLIGIADADTQRAAEVAEQYETDHLSTEELLTDAEAVSVVVPTQYHYDVVTSCLDKGVATLIEKPILKSLDRAEKLLSEIEKAGVPVQVGHIERFNPAVSVVSKIANDLDILSVRARRLGPEPDRRIQDSAVLDLMIHDIDIVLSLFEEMPTAVTGTATREGRHASALLEFGPDRIASLTASRKTQKKVRVLEITSEECFIEIDYLDQSVEVHRNSVPEYIEEDGAIRFKHESLVERPVVQNGEPLRRELNSFAQAVKDGSTPEVTAQDGVDALSVALDIEKQSQTKQPHATQT